MSTPHKLLQLVACLGFFVLLLGFAQSSSAAQAIGVVTSMEGTAYAVMKGQKRNLEKSSQVFVKDTLHTLADSSLGLKFEDDTTLQMDENTTVVLEEFQYDPKPKGIVSMLTRMLTGLVRMTTGKIVERDRESFEFKTPIASLGIRGTEFFAMTTSEGEEIGVTQMDEGHVVALSSETDQTTIDKAGFYVKVTPDGKFSPLMRLTQDVTRRIMRVQGTAIRKSVTPRPKAPGPGHY